MPMLIEKLLHFGIIGRPYFTKSVSLDRMCNRAIIVQSTMASVALRCIDPFYKTVEVATHDWLLISNCPCLVACGHWCVVRHTCYVLPQGIKAVVDVLAVQGGRIAALVVDKCAPNELLLMSQQAAIAQNGYSLPNSAVGERPSRNTSLSFRPREIYLNAAVHARLHNHPIMLQPLGSCL